MVWILIVGLSAALIYASMSMRKAKENELIGEGKAISREKFFWEQSETFTTCTSYETIVDEIRKRDYSDLRADVYPNVNGEKAVLWKSSYAWNAKLVYLGTKEGKSVFSFSFTAWKSRNGAPFNTNSMNVMMTSVEKIFLALDPATTVESHQMQLKSKMRLF